MRARRRRHRPASSTGSSTKKSWLKSSPLESAKTSRSTRKHSNGSRTGTDRRTVPPRLHPAITTLSSPYRLSHIHGVSHRSRSATDQTQGSDHSNPAQAQNSPAMPVAIFSCTMGVLCEMSTGWTALRLGGARSTHLFMNSNPFRFDDPQPPLRRLTFKNSQRGS